MRKRTSKIADMAFYSRAIRPRRKTGTAAVRSGEKPSARVAAVATSPEPRAAQEVTERLSRLEDRVAEQDAKIAGLPTTGQVVAVMEQLLSKTVASIDERLNAQAHSIEALRAAISQTDNLLESVLESLESMESDNEALDHAHNAFLREAV